MIRSQVKLKIISSSNSIVFNMENSPFKFLPGVRSAMLDFQEIKGSMGSSSLIMEAKGHRIFFTLEDLPGYLEIKRSGWTGFAYACVINDKPVSEATSEVATDQNDIFRPKIIETTFTPDEVSEHPVAWYVLRTTRLKDNTTTVVHRLIFTFNSSLHFHKSYIFFPDVSKILLSSTPK
jgi:hypothetical protein